MTERLGQYLDAMSDNITGIRHLMMRDPKTGKFERITGDAKQIDKALKTSNAVWIYTKDPNVQAFTDPSCARMILPFQDTGVRLESWNDGINPNG